MSDIVTLTLTKEEAAFLAVLLMRVGGSPTNSVRSHAEDIGRKLAALRAQGAFRELPKMHTKGCGSLYFHNRNGAISPAALDWARGEGRDVKEKRLLLQAHKRNLARGVCYKLAGE
jgi:hypothetical protein